jgi:signal transduction histidine kinase
MNLTDDNLKLTAILKSDELHQFLVECAGVSRYQIFVLDPAAQQLTRMQSFPGEPDPPASALPLGDPLAELFCSRRCEHLSADRPADAAGDETAADQARQVLARQGAEHAFLLRASGRMLGLLLVGGGSAPPALPEHHLVCLKNFVRHLNGLLSLVLTAESHELLGQLSRGLAHDLKGWLTPITTCLQLWSGGPPDRAKAETLLPTALKSLEAIQACLEQARHFSLHRRPRLRPTKLARVVRKSIALVESLLAETRVLAVVQTPPDLEAEVDEVLMLRLLNNLLTNAIQASPPGAAIQVSLQETAAGAGGADWVRLSIQNDGAMDPGQPPGPRIKEDSRWGLGLQICREIVELHGGRMAITSASKAPTTVVQVDLPRSQSKRGSVQLRP